MVVSDESANQFSPTAADAIAANRPDAAGHCSATIRCPDVSRHHAAAHSVTQILADAKRLDSEGFVTDEKRLENWLAWGRPILAFAQYVGSSPAVDGVRICQKIREIGYRDGVDYPPPPNSLIGPVSRRNLRMGDATDHVDIRDTGEYEYMIASVVRLKGHVADLFDEVVQLRDRGFLLTRVPVEEVA